MHRLASVEWLDALAHVLALGRADEEVVRERDEGRAIVGGEAARVDEDRRTMRLVAEREARVRHVHAAPARRRFRDPKRDLAALVDASFERATRVRAAAREREERHRRERGRTDP